MDHKYECLDLTGAVWRKSSHSGPYTDNCVEVAMLGSHVAVRDSKDKAQPALVFTRDEWQAFLGGVRDAEFDL
jgi:uncharacterized protein DUF397